MIVEVTTNHAEIKSILLDKDLNYDSLGLSADEIDLPSSALYIAGYAPEIFAVGCFHKFRDGIKFHPSVLKSHRRKHARDFIQTCLTMVKYPIYVEFPKGRKRLFNYAIKSGFDSITNNKDSSNTILMRLS